MFEPRTENTELTRHALAYVGELYRELSQENGAPTLGTQNQAVEFILADPELCRTVEEWARAVDPDEATTAPPRRLPRDSAYERVRNFMLSTMEEPRFARRHSG